MKWLRRSLWGLLGLGVLAGVLAGAAAGGVFWVLGNEAGTAWLAARLLARTAPVLTIGRVSGTWLGGLVLEDVRLRLPRDELDIARLALDWNAAAALGGTLAFTRAEAAPVAYRRVGTGASGTGAPDLPFVVRIDAGSVAALTVLVGGQTFAFGNTRFAATFRDRRLELERVATTSSTIGLAGDATVELRDGVVLAVDGEWSGPVAAVAAAGRFTLAGTWPELDLRHELTAPFAATAEGVLGFAGTPRFDLALTWQGLAWPSVTWLSSPSGEGTVVGTLGDYRYEGQGELDVDGRAAGLTVRGTGVRGELALERLALAARSAERSAGTLVAAGAASLGGRTARLDVTASDFDPVWIRTEWPGRLTGTGQVRAALTPRAMVELEAIELTGELRGYPVTASGTAVFAAPDRWRFAALRLDSGANFVLLDGTLDSTGLELTAAAEVEQLDLLWPGLGGALTGRVAVGGSWQAPRASGSFVARSLAYAGTAFARLAVSGEAGLTPDAPLALTIEADGVARGIVAAERLRATVAGTTAAHRVALELQAEQWRAEAAATGGLAALTWRGSIERFDVEEPRLGSWRLEAPAASVFGRSQVTVATSCLLHTLGGRWCAELDWQGRVDDRLVVSARNFELSTLRPLLPPELTVDGVLQLSVSLFDLTGEPRGALAVTGERTSVRVAFGEEQVFATELNELRAGVTLTAGRLEGEAGVRSTSAGRVALRARIDDVGSPDAAIGGSLNVAWPDLAFLTLLSPELGGIAGSLAVDLTVGGTVGTPTLDGQAAWSDGRIALPEWGFVVEGIEATATSPNGRALEFNATGRAGDGLLTLTGATQLDAAAGWPTRLQLRGDAVRAVQLPQAEIVVTPDLAVDVALPDVQVSGTVHVPRAALTLTALPEQAVAPSPDAVLHGRNGREQSRPLRLGAAIDLTLGDDVRYSGLNLATDVAGQLRFTMEPERSASATGTLTLAGTYNAYGQPLELERGQLLFGGPLDDPGLDVSAVRVIDTTRVGVELTGTLKAPRTRVFSTPAMSEADALSYLLFGRSVSGSAADETSTLQTAAISMGLQQALPVVQRIGTSLGLDELSLQTTETDAGAVMAGKYLTPKVYIRFSYGLFNRMGGLLLRFRVNERLSIETNSGEQNSMDLLYTVEKD